MDENRYITDNVLRRYLGMDELVFDGGKGSGNFNHAGRKGFVGGSAKATNTAEITTLGKEYTGVTGKDAIDLLMKERQGFVRNAFMRKDIGAIALIWGNDEMGLQHIIKRRKKTNQPLGKLLSSLTEVIEKGELSYADKGRFQIDYKGKKAIIEVNLNGEDFQFLFTAYYEK